MLFGLGLVYGKDFFMDRPALCDFASTICLGACVTSLLSIGGISFNQCLHICHGNHYNSFFNLRTNVIMCATFWILGFSFALPGLVGWTDNVYDHKMLECIWDRTNSLSYNIFFSSFVVFMPTFVIAISYVKIFLYVYRSKKLITKMCDNHKQRKNRGTASIRVARSLFIIFAIFVLCWAPYALLVLIDFQNQAPLQVHLYILLLAHLHATLNAIIYWVTNKHFRTGYLVVLARLVGQTVKNTIRSSINEPPGNMPSVQRIEGNSNNEFLQMEDQAGNKIIPSKPHNSEDGKILFEKGTQVNPVKNDEELVTERLEKGLDEDNNETNDNVEVKDELSETDVKLHVGCLDENADKNVEKAKQEGEEITKGKDEYV